MIAQIRYRLQRLMIVLVLTSNSLCYAEHLENEPVYLTLQECIQAALDNNLDIKITKLDNLIAGTEKTYAEAVYDMILSGKITYTQDETEKTNIILPSKELINEYEVGAEKRLPTGTTLSFDYSNIRDWTDSTFASLNPSYTSEISFTARQSMLKNVLGIQDRGKVNLARLNIQISDLETYRKIEKVIAESLKKYWHLVFSLKNLDIKKNLLKKAKKMHKINESHFKSGFIEKKDLIASEANIRQRQVEVLISENELEDAVNLLKLHINRDFPNPILPSDDFEAPKKYPDLIKNLQTAMENRKDIISKKKELEKNKLTLVMKKNDMLPELDLFATYTANGVDRKVTKSHGTLTTIKFPKYYFGGEVSFPLENNQAKSEYNKAEFEKIKVINELKQLEKEIISEIDERLREVSLSIKKIEKTSKIRALQELKLKEEEDQYKLGRSSSKIVIDFQSDLLNARLQEARAYMDYYYSLIDLEESKDTLLDNLGLHVEET